MTSLLIGIGFASAMAISAPPAGAEEPASNPTIVVVGQDEEQRRRELKNFVRELGIAKGQRTAARWVDRVCPSVIGLEPAHAAIVKSRVRAVARQAGARVGGSGCDPNIVIAFSGDGGALARAIRTKAPTRLSEVPVTDRPSLFNGPSPIRWWYSTEVRDRSGTPAASAPAPWTGGNAEGGGSVLPMTGDSTTLNHYGSSLVSTQVMRALQSATILVDANLAEGHSLSSVADYVALIALAEIELDARPPDSILGLFADPDAPRRVSSRDRAFLQALYRLPLDRSARQHRSRLVNDMAKQSGDD
jgi:hypothetical protein